MLQRFGTYYAELRQLFISGMFATVSCARRTTRERAKRTTGCHITPAFWYVLRTRSVVPANLGPLKLRRTRYSGPSLKPNDTLL